MLGLGLKLGLAQRPSAAAAYTPASLFSSNAGAFYDVSDLTSMRQGSTAGSTAAAVGSPVGYLADKSGNGNHAIQATGTKCPILRQSGALYYLEFDGVDDYLQCLFTLPQPMSRISAFRPLSWTGGPRVYAGSANLVGVLFQSTATPGLAVYEGAAVLNNGATLNTDWACVEVHNGASSSLQFNNQAAATGNAGAGAPGGWTIGATGPSGGSCANIWFYGGLAIGRTLTTNETNAARTYMGAKAGLTV